MKNLSNIEKSKFHKGEYVGYTAIGVWRIARTNSTYGNWLAQLADGSANICDFTLSGLSDKLKARDAKDLAVLACRY